MNAHAATLNHPLILKPDPHSPALRATGRDSLDIKGGVRFGGAHFFEDTLVNAPPGGYIAGSDYIVRIVDGAPVAELAADIPAGDDILGGFHFAPGGNAPARAGGDEIPAINPLSLWDQNFRPACPDPRGMTLIDAPHGKFWCDIYLTGVNHAEGTSRFGVTIADGEDCPRDAKGKPTKAFDYETAKAALAAHSKGLLGLEDFIAAAFGVTEGTSADEDPETTGLDAARTSRFGLMQATGNMLIWGNNGDPDEPRASLFGGSWLDGVHAGSRYANVGYWPGDSAGTLGARGRSGHLQPV